MFWHHATIVKELTSFRNLLASNQLEDVTVLTGKKSKSVTVSHLTAVQIYIDCLGGVNKTDMLLALYCKNCCSRKWWHRLFFYTINQWVVNAWLKFISRVVETIPYVKFLTIIFISHINPSTTDGDAEMCVSVYQNVVPTSISFNK